MFALADYDYALPPERIAQEPARPRDSARLLVVGRDGLADRCVSDLPELLRPGDLLVVNDTRVIPAQLEGTAGNARIGVTLDHPLPDGTWEALARNARRLKPGTVIHFGAATAEVIARACGTVRLRFVGDPTAAATLALPPYIDRDQGPTPADAEDYQTTFARHLGAVAAPTAGLHLTPRLIEALAARGISTARVTLHVGAGTFLPIRVDDVRAHRLHAERATLPPETAQAIAATRHEGGRIVAVGTTSLRTLETAAGATGTAQPWCGETDLYITPGFAFRVADLLLTNFHLPRTSLMVLVAAFAGRERIMAAYAHALAAGYRFASYGDATLLERAA
ncbi:tRNA preQ1(34) S-adenosylmethionine ribosyltransferase-isomerase QueA [Elioraea sp.]|uniref:tRNA preQ1(34) S-adenosylmethionine ribosyltransferase-isomerase QueA n=1 Tax=Elioraea sp. TaxID=2185103 RepID=UPI003F6E46AC